MARFIPKHLKQWTLPKYYMGPHWDGYWSSGFGQSRDSDELEKSNFAVVVQELQKIKEPKNWKHDDPCFQVVRDSHWAVGWVEWIAIHPAAHRHLKCADRLRERFEEYPILDEQDHSQRENDSCEQIWKHCYNAKERAKYLRDHAERYIPGKFKELRKAVSGDWYHAANILPCPNDINS